LAKGLHYEFVYIVSERGAIKPSAQVRVFRSGRPHSAWAIPGFDAGAAPASSVSAPLDGSRCVRVGRSTRTAANAGRGRFGATHGNSARSTADDTTPGRGHGYAEPLNARTPCPAPARPTDGPLDAPEHLSPPAMVGACGLQAAGQASTDGLEGHMWGSMCRKDDLRLPVVGGDAGRPWCSRSLARIQRGFRIFGLRKFAGAGRWSRTR
jgi:hypothetical protein